MTSSLGAKVPDNLREHLTHRTKANGIGIAEIQVEESPSPLATTTEKPLSRNELPFPRTWTTPLLALVGLIIASLIVGFLSVSSQTDQNYSRGTLFLIALSTSADFATGLSTLSLIPYIYFFSKRRTDIPLGNPFIIQAFVYLLLCGSAHLFSGHYITKISLFVVMLKFLSALSSVGVIGSLYLLFNNLTSIPSRVTFRKIQEEVLRLRKQLSTLDSTMLCNKLRFLDSEEEISCVLVQDISNLIQCDILGSYCSSPPEDDIESFGDSFIKTDSILTVSSSSENYSLPRHIPFQLLEDSDGIIILRRAEDRIMASLLPIDNSYERESRLSIPLPVESLLSELPFNFFVILSNYYPAAGTRNELLLCFSEPIELDSSRMILLRQSAAIAQLAFSKLQQISLLSRRARQLDEDNEMLKDEKSRSLTALDEKTKFITNISEDIRNDLVKLQSTVLAQETETNTDISKFAGVLSPQIASLLSFVNDVVEFSRPLDTENVPQDIWDFPLELQNTCKSIREQFGNRFSGQLHLASIPSDIPRFVIGERRVFLSSLSTLIPFLLELTGKGTVLLTVKCLTFNSENKFFVEIGGQRVRCIANSMVQLDFVGSGTGLSPHEADKAFDALHKQNNTHSGLSLAIIKQKIHRVGGKIRLDSTVNVGTTITVILPFVVADVKPDSNLVINSSPVISLDAASSPSPFSIHKTGKEKQETNVSKPKPKATEIVKREPGSELHILIAEDNLLNQKVLVRLLAKLGHKDVTLVTQGDLAVEAVKESEQPYDLIFMDLHMPVMGGIEACKLIREIESDHYPQIIACTANAQNDVKSQFTKLGAFAFIPKPINVKNLAAALDQFYSL